MKPNNAVRSGSTRRTREVSPRAVEELTDRGLRTRTSLLVAARQVFERDGFLEARIADIADGAGVAHGTFYVYFDSKESIFLEVVKEVHEELLLPVSQWPTEPLDPVATIEDSVRHYFSVYWQNRRLMVEWERVAAINHDFETVQRELRDAYARWSEGGVRRFQREARADPNLDPLFLARATTTMVSEFAYRWCADGLEYDLDYAVAQMKLLLSNAMAVRAPAPASRAKR
jgi:AcrR family transcriptional regulator